MDLGFAPTGTEWRLPQQAENRFRVTKALLAEEWILKNRSKFGRNLEELWIDLEELSIDFVRFLE